MKMSEYLTIMKQTADNLALAGASVDIGDLTSYVILELDAEYFPITFLFNEKKEMTWQGLHSTLVTFENALINNNVVNSNTEAANMTANLVFNRQNSFNQDNHQNQYRGQTQYRGQGRGNTNYNYRRKDLKEEADTTEQCLKT